VAAGNVPVLQSPDHVRRADNRRQKGLHVGGHVRMKSAEARARQKSALPLMPMRRNSNSVSRPPVRRPSASAPARAPDARIARRAALNASLLDNVPGTLADAAWWRACVDRVQTRTAACIGHREDGSSDKLLVSTGIGPAAALNDWFSSRSVQNSYAVCP